jgi:hypothetical protein
MRYAGRCDGFPMLRQAALWTPAMSILPGAGGAVLNQHERAAAGQAAIASSRRLVTAGPKQPMTTNTTTMAPAMKANTPTVP